MELLLASFTSVAIAVFAAAFIGLAGVSVFLGWRSGVFTSQAPRKRGAARYDGETAQYLDHISRGIAGERDRQPNLGLAQFADESYIRLLSHLDMGHPPEEPLLQARHQAFRDAVGIFVDSRRSTVQALDRGTGLIRQAVRDGNVDCLAAAKARQLMSTYGPSVDPLLEEIMRLCEEEKAAWEDMRKRMTELDVALYKFKYELRKL